MIAGTLYTLFAIAFALATVILMITQPVYDYWTVALSGASIMLCVMAINKLRKELNRLLEEAE